MGYTYPPAPATYAGDIESIHRLLQRPALIAKRVQDLLRQRYIADVLLKGRFVAVGGSVTYESGEPIGTLDNPRAVAPGAEYPMTDLGGGAVSTAKTVKWGQDVPITDEAIARLLLNPVNKSLGKVANQNVIFVDSVALSLITTAVTTTRAATGLWTAAATTAEQILTDAMKGRASILALNLGYDPDVVTLDDMTFAVVKAKFIAAGYLPREDGRALTGASFPTVEGMTWLPTPNGIAGQAVIADTNQLGGMADEDLHSPGYVRAADPGTTSVEVKVMRTDEVDGYRVRGRRVTVPVVTDPSAAVRITGVAA